MSGLLTHWGEDTVTATLGPIGVDGLLVMSTSAIIAASVTRVGRPAEESALVAAAVPLPAPLLPAEAPPQPVQVAPPIRVDYATTPQPPKPTKAPAAQPPKSSPSREQARAILMDLRDFEAEPNAKLSREHGGSDTFWRQRKDALRAELAAFTTEAGNLRSQR